MQKSSARRVSGSAGGVGSRRAQPGEDVAEHDRVGCAQVVQVELAHASAVRALGGLELLKTGVGQLGVRSTAVVRGGAAGDVAERDEPVDQAREPAAAEQDLIG